MSQENTKPHTYVIAALSADGQLGPAHATNSTSWTSGADTQFFKEKTTKSGVIVMGKTTFDTIGRPLPNRKNVVYHFEDFDQEGIHVTQKPPTELLQELANEGFSEVAITGGSSIYTQFIEAGLVDTIYITIEPKLFGTGTPFLTKELNLDLTLISHTQLGDDSVLLEYNIN